METDNGRGLSSDEMRARYDIEREKRLRSDGIHQYHELKGVYQDFDADPYAQPLRRDPVEEDTDVLIVGAGFGGMMTAAHLRKYGVDDFRILDKAGDFGGTWYWNRYPGCMCDVESYVYLPLLEETGYMPRHKYAHAEEIFEYCQLLARTFDLYPSALFQTEVTDMTWDDHAKRWRVTTSRGDAIAARFVVICGGVLHKAKLPDIPGIETFQGHAFHTSRWDYSVTGGGPEAPMDRLADKVVGVVGTGATAVQALPKLAEAAKHVYVFQRTPSTVSERNQRETDPEWFKEMSATPGWQQRRIDNFVAMTTGKNPAVDMVQDRWTYLFAVDTKRDARDPEEAAALELRDFRQMEEIRERIDRIVKDPVTAEALKPWYKLSCKRPCFHDDYLPAFNLANVTLVDTAGRGIDRITASSVVVRDDEYPVDVMVYATGFELTSFYTHRLGFDPKGRGGVSMSEAWAHGAYTLHGIHAHGFPNLCMSSYIQGGQHLNFAYTITQIAKHTAHTVARCLAEGIAVVEPTIEAEEEWWQVVLGTVGGYAAYLQTCTPGYLSNEGQLPEENGSRSAAYMHSALDFVRTLEAWREEGSLAGLRLTPAVPGP